MTGEEWVRLGSISEIRAGGRLGLTGRDFVASGFPAYGAGGLNGYVSIAEYEQEGVILSSIGARCGKCFYAEGGWASLANTQVILPDVNRLEPLFLWYQLNDEKRWPRSGTGQPFIKPSDVKAHEVWVPDMPTQREVVRKLRAVDDIRALQKKVSRLLSGIGTALICSLDFRGWNVRWLTLGDICRPRQYPTIPKSAMESSGYPVFGANGPIGHSSKYTHDRAVVLVGCRGSCGTVHIAPPFTYATGNAMALDDLDSSVVNLRYLAEWLRVRGLDDVVTGSSQPQITGQNIRRVEVPIPDISVQESVARRLEAVDELKRQVSASQDGVDSLMSALRASAFERSRR